MDITYDSAGKVSIDNGVGVALLWFDNRNWVVKTQDPIGIAAYNEFCNWGHLTKITDNDGYSRSYTLSKGLITSTTDQLGNKTEFTYSNLATLTSATDPKGNKTRYEYDSKGNLLATNYPDGISHAIKPSGWFPQAFQCLNERQ